MIRKSIIFSLFLLAFSFSAHAQGIRWDLGAPGSAGAVTTANSGGLPPLLALPGVSVSWCNHPANAVPCTNFAPTYTSLAATTQCPSNAPIVLQGSNSCQATGDNFGNLGVYTKTNTNCAGTCYDYTLTVNGVSSGPYLWTPGVPAPATLLQTGGVNNPNQAIENLKPGPNVTLTPDPFGGTLISAAGSGNTGAAGLLVTANSISNLLCDSTDDDTAHMASLLAGIGSTNTKLIYPNTGSCPLSSMTLPANITNDYTPGGALKALPNVTAPGNAAFDASGSNSAFNPSGSTSCSVTVTPTAAGESYVLVTLYGFLAGGIQAGSPTSTISSDGLQLIQQSSPGFASNSGAWLITNVTAGTRTFTIPYNVAAEYPNGCAALAFSGMGGSIDMDGPGAFAYGFNSPMSPGAATFQAGDLLFSYSGQVTNASNVGLSQTCTAGSGFTQPSGTVGNIGTNGSLCVQYQLNSSAGSITPTQAISSAPTNNYWVSSVIGLRPGPSTIRILGNIINPYDNQIFLNGTGTNGAFSFQGNSSISRVSPEWWGASVGASAAVNTPAIQAAIVGAFGNGGAAYNKTLDLSRGIYNINDETKWYNVVGNEGNRFLVDCGGNGGIRQTVANKRIMDGQSVAYGNFRNCVWKTTATNSVDTPLLDIDFNGVTTVGHLAPQFLDFDRNTYGGQGTHDIGTLIAKSGGGAQGSNINWYNPAFNTFGVACLQIGASTSVLAQNALGNTTFNGDFQHCPGGGVVVYGGGISMEGHPTFENDIPFGSQTGPDLYCYAPQGGCQADGMRSEGHLLAWGSGLKITNSFNLDQSYHWNTQIIPGTTTLAVNSLISGSGPCGTGAYYKITVDGGPFGGLGTTSATSGSATTIVNSGASWTTNAFTGYRACVLTGANAGAYGIISGNTGTTITVASWLTNYAQLVPTAPDATSTFEVEPNWDTQTTSGGMTWQAFPCHAISGNADALNLSPQLDHVSVSGCQINAIAGSLTAGTFRNIFVTRPDWIASAGFNALDNNIVHGNYENVQVVRTGSSIAGGYGLSWKFTRNNGNGAFSYSGYDQHNEGTTPFVWSCAATAGGASCADVGIGGRSDSGAGNTNYRNILEYFGMLGPATPFLKTNANSGNAQVVCGLGTGTGTSGVCQFFAATPTSSGSTVQTATQVATIDANGFNGILGGTTPKNAFVANLNDSALGASTTVCTDGSKNLTTSGCSLSGLTLQTIGSPNTSQSLLNFIASTTNATGYTITPSNPSGGQEQFELTGTAIAAAGGTGIDSHSSTGIAQVLAGVWSVSPTLANGTKALTQSPGDNSTNVATTAYTDTALAAKANTASPVLSGTPDASGAAQFKLPVHTTFATLANGECGYDSTNKNFHCWVNGVDTIMAPLAPGFVSGNCGQPTSTASSWLIVDAGSPCGTSSMVYPTVGVPQSTGSAWGPSLTAPAGSVTQLTGTVGNGTAVLGVSAIASSTCATVITASASGVTTADVVRYSFNGDPTATVGYTPATTGTLYIVSYPTAGAVNFKVCNPTSASITPGAVTLNWQVTR